MACYDFKGQQVLDVCAELGIAVPEQVAVIGVDNDSHLCSLCTPPLTSVVPDTRRAGYEAARLLDRLMQGSPVPADAILVKPVGIVDRQSTDVYAIDDADVVRALRFIRAHACEGIRVADVLREVSLSRRVLESRFRELLGRTPHAEIHRLQMERACRLLTETDLPLVQVASQTGLAHAEYLSVAFKRHTGLSPRDYRRQHRLSTPGSTDAG
jgi:LacI family transcriptional regulator